MSTKLTKPRGYKNCCSSEAGLAPDAKMSFTQGDFLHQEQINQVCDKLDKIHLNLNSSTSLPPANFLQINPDKH